MVRGTKSKLTIFKLKKNKIMKRIMLLCISAVAIIATSFTVHVNEVLPIGSKLPNATVKMKDISGKQVSISEVVKDNGVLVMFSCNTCPYVIKNQQRTIAICDFAQKMNIGVILLNSNEAQRTSDDSYDEMISYAKDQRYNWKYVVDKNNEMADAFGANRTPECFLFNKKLMLVYHGAIDDNPSDESAVKQQHLRNAIMLTASGKEVVVKETRSVGCSIKRGK